MILENGNPILISAVDTCIGVIVFSVFSGIRRTADNTIKDFLLIQLNTGLTPKATYL